jgi:hypothetical protein
LALLDGGDEGWIHLGKPCSALDHLLVYVLKSESLGDEPSDFLAEGSVRSRDAHQLCGQGVCLLSGCPEDDLWTHPSFEAQQRQ